MRGIAFANEAYPIVDEYFRRKTLTELGYTSGPTSELSAVKADCFQMIASEIARVRDQESKKAQKARKRKR